jgi:hypothetical protein
VPVNVAVGVHVAEFVVVGDPDEVLLEVAVAVGVGVEVGVGDGVGVGLVVCVAVVVAVGVVDPVRVSVLVEVAESE